ncbi:hypothetical protein PJ985_11030 [Streptomyces sp. ACA25]|uniref:hypothetical protein n=1 Tax=Streptomyces sp. ACA25 TaxID=3022596 RepID=UPI0023072B5C|nr:hypothetical protein [Streptomyces sp. ACA25]MDB1088098.1 hypothetical protein [Streptomyces sp. ACA25]
MPTDHACQAAVEQAVRGLAPVRAQLAPPPPPEDGQDDGELPASLRMYLGDSGERRPPAPGRRPPPPVNRAQAGSALLTFLRGVQADLSGSLAGWYAGLHYELSLDLDLPSAAAEPGARPSNEWQALAEVQKACDELLTLLANRPSHDPVRSGELSWRLALVEDVFAGALRRMGIPGGTSVRCSAELAAAAGSLFGIRTAPQQPTRSGSQSQATA